MQMVQSKFKINNDFAAVFTLSIYLKIILLKPNYITAPIILFMNNNNR
jgi:hypothetical protein